MDAQSHVDQHPIRSTISRQKNGRTNDQKTTCTRLYQTHATTNGLKGKFRVYALPTRHNGMARRSKSTNPLPYIQASPEMLRTIPHQVILSEVTYELRIPPQWKIHLVFHANLLTPYKEMALHRTNYT